MVAHPWTPIEGLNSDSGTIDFQEIDSLHKQWASFREQRETVNPDAYKDFFERLERRLGDRNGNN